MSDSFARHAIVRVRKRIRFRATPGREYLGTMFARLMRSLGRFLAWVADVAKHVGGAASGGRGADAYATQLYEQPRDDYRP